MFVIEISTATPTQRHHQAFSCHGALLEV